MKKACFAKKKVWDGTNLSLAKKKKEKKRFKSVEEKDNSFIVARQFLL